MYSIGEILKRRGYKTKERNCITHGRYRAVFFNGKESRCPDCVNSLIFDSDQKKSYENNDRLVQMRISDIGIPLRFSGKTLSNYVAETQEQISALSVATSYADNWCDVKKDGRSLLLLGNPGTGKTHIAIGIAKKIAEENNASAFYISFIDLIEEIKSGWRSDKTDNKTIEKIKTVDLLIIDEISSAYNSDSEKIQLFRIINKRYEAILPTIVISNSDLDETKRQMGAAAFDRLREGGGKMISFKWGSNRGGKKDG